MGRRLNSTFLLTALLVMSLTIFAPVDARATNTLEATKETVILNGWELVSPTIAINPKTGKKEAIYVLDIEKGTKAKKKLADGEKATYMWRNPGKTQVNVLVPGFKLQESNNIMAWWLKNKPVVELSVSKDGKWVPISSLSKPATPAQPPVVVPPVTPPTPHNPPMTKSSNQIEAERLMAAVNNAEKQYGRNSTQYKAAYDAYIAWASRGGNK